MCLYLFYSLSGKYDYEGSKYFFVCAQCQKGGVNMHRCISYPFKLEKNKAQKSVSLSSQKNLPVS